MRGLWAAGLVAVLLGVVGCGSEPAVEPEADGQDAAGEVGSDTHVADTTDAGTDTTEPTDTELVDTGATQDTAAADTTGPQDTSGDTGVDDTTSADVDACSSVVAELQAARTAVSATCERGSQCGTRANPLCPDGGCYTHFVLGNDLTALDDAQTAYTDAGCGTGAVCDCMAPPTALACDQGTCTTCPAAGSCPYTCNMDCQCYVDACGCDQPLCVDGGTASCAELESRMQQAALDLGACTTDDDCVVTGSPICPELGCYLAANRHGARGELDNIVSAYVSAGCPMAVCSCTPPPEAAACVNGRCEGIASP